MTAFFSKSPSLLACTVLVGAGLVLTACSESEEQATQAPEAAPETVTDTVDAMTDTAANAMDDAADATDDMMADASDAMGMAPDNEEQAAEEGSVEEERQKVMEAYGKAAKDIADMMMGKAEMNVDTLKAHADHMVNTSGDALNALFPEGSMGGDTEALPAIWESWDEFAALSADLNTHAVAFQAALDADDPKTAMVPSFSAMGKACQDCHTKFRKEQKWGQ